MDHGAFQNQSQLCRYSHIARAKPCLPFVRRFFGRAGLFLFLILVGLLGSVMYVPNEDAFQGNGDEGCDQDVEENGLVVEDGDGLFGGPDLGKPVELAHRAGDEMARRDGRKK